MRATPERLGLLFAVSCAVNGAFVPAVAKLTTGRADALLVAAVSTACAGVAAVAVLALRGQLALLVTPRLAPRLLLIAALGTACAHLLFYVGASRTSAIVATLCLQIEPAYALLLSWLVLGHRPTPRRLGATALLLGGIALALGSGAVEGSIGIWLLLATPLCWQLSHLVVLRRLAGTPAVVLSGARYLYGGVLLAAIWLVGGAPSPPLTALVGALPLLAVQGVVLGLGGTLLWYEAIARLDLTRATAIVVPLIPLLSLAASFALLGEVATPRQWLGLGLTAIGILVFVTGPAAVSSPARGAAE
ncbi:MAG: DMT family transporter [Deltaproteobacteria bacterium]|nr:DMT family transporter [Deltaproteobacteria bacterium]